MLCIAFVFILPDLSNGSVDVEELEVTMSIVMMNIGIRCCEIWVVGTPR